MGDGSGRISVTIRNSVFGLLDRLVAKLAVLNLLNYLGDATVSS